MKYFVIATILLTSGLIAVSLGEVVLERVARDADADPADTPKAPPLTSPKVPLTKRELTKKYNLAEDVDEDYPAVFNIILFISISLILALIAICVTIATMDPGRDSLIYRVTSAQRYKKDN